MVHERWLPRLEVAEVEGVFALTDREEQKAAVEVHNHRTHAWRQAETTGSASARLVSRVYLSCNALAVAACSGRYRCELAIEVK